MKTTTLRHPRSIVMAILAAAALLATTACGAGGEAAAALAPASASASASASLSAPSTAQLNLYVGMRELWEQHMEWTYATVVAFAADTKGVTPSLNRLLKNQADIGNAIKPFYGDDAGHALTVLLKAHINGAVAILAAAKAGNAAAEKQAVTAEYANAKAIGDFLAKANPANWPKKAMEHMLEMHIDQTLVYATEQLQGKYAASIRDFGKAEQHMNDMGDVLAQGIIAQFPDKFSK